MNRIVCAVLVLGLLQSCAVFDAPRATPAPPSAAPPLQSAPPPAEPVSTPYPAPAASPMVPEASGLQAGAAHAAQPSMLRARPQASAQVEHYIPAGASLRLQLRQVNGDGAWWFAEYQGATGWVSERGLSQ